MFPFYRQSLIYLLLSYAVASPAEYSKVSNAGHSIPTSTVLGGATDEWACTYEDKTQLMWEIKTQEGGGVFVDKRKIGFRDKTWTFSWFMTDSALNAGVVGFENGGTCFDGQLCNTENYISQVNAQGLCGANDWRLPTAKELAALSLSSSSPNSSEPLRFNDYYGGDYAKSGFWSSTTTQLPENAFYFRGSNGEYGRKSEPHRVFLVRTAPTFKSINFKEARYQEENWDFKSPSSLRLAPDETLFVADSFNHRIVQLNQAGLILNSFGDLSHAQNSPGLLVFAPDGSLLVDDLGNNRVQRFKTDGTLISTISKPKQSPLLDMDLTVDGGIVVLSDSNHVHRLNADGSIKWLFERPREEKPNTSSTVINTIHNISIAADDTVCLHTSRATTIPGYAPIVSWNDMSLGVDGKANGKSCVLAPSHNPDVITKAGIKFVAEPYSNRIQKLTPNVTEYSYVANTGTAIFENILVGNLHYWVKLQNQGHLQFKVIKAYPINPVLDNKSSVFDETTNLVTLPKVTADGVDYEVIMERLVNGLFAVTSAVPLQH